ncbi:MAG: argininosuccinate lyase, partial [Rickettsiales bacterium]|nr:argininosuccinate lyase [Rickettsiales bacterium]
AMAAAASQAYANATDLADWLVRELAMPFRDAHHTTAKLVKLATQKKKMLEELTLADMQSVEKRIRKDVFAVLAPLASAESRKSFGGTAPSNVKKAAAEAKKRFLA